MPLESGAVYISDLVPSNPDGNTDLKSEGDDHLRIIKSTIKTTFPSITGVVDATHVHLSACKGMGGNANTFLTIPGAAIAGYLVSSSTVEDVNGDLKSWRDGVSQNLTGAAVSFNSVPTDAKMIRFVWKNMILSSDDKFIMTGNNLSNYEGVTHRYGIVAESNSVEAWATTSATITFDQSNSPDTQSGMLTMVKLNATNWVIESRSSETLDTTRGQIFNSTGYATDAGTTTLTFATAGAATFSAGVITMYVYN